MDNKLAILGGTKSVTVNHPDTFAWPQFEKEDFEAVTRVMSMPNYIYWCQLLSERNTNDYK
jgi:hypothetical protein